MNKLGTRLRELRKSKSILLRQVAAKLEIDTAVISKIESGNKLPSESQVSLFADFYGINPQELLLLRLVDIVLEAVRDKPNATIALELAIKELGKR